MHKRKLTRRAKKQKLIKSGGRLLSQANRAWRRGDMKQATEYTNRFKTIDKRIKRL